MKLKSIASLCKNRKMVYIYSGSGCQYIGQGCACWMVPGTLEVSKGNVLTIFDIPEDKQPDWMVWEESLLDLMADVLQGEEQAEIYPFDLNCYDSTYRLLKDADGISVIDTQYLAPLAGIKQGLQYYIRRTRSGQEVVAVKTGFELLALIAASNAEIIKDAFLTTCRTCAGSAAAGRTSTSSRKRMHAAAADPETGEVEENEDA